MSGLFITGTDTGVGKTAVTAGIARLLADSGANVGVMKPVETGAPAAPDWPQDAALLRAAARVDDAREDIVPLTYADPLAPLVAARREGIHVDIGTIEDAYRRQTERHDHLLVEGAGGLSVSLTNTLDMAALALRLQLPLLIVARIGLGTLNHTFLTVAYARSLGLAIVGLFVNTPEDAPADIASETNPEILAERCGLPVLGIARHASGGITTPEAAAELVRGSGLDMPALLQAMSSP